MDKITLEIGGELVTFIVTYYCQGSQGSWDEPSEPPYVEWYAQDQVVDAIIDEFDIADKVEERLLAAVESRREERQAESLIEREMDRRATWW